VTVGESLARYTVSPQDSSLSFEARSTLHAVQGSATSLAGFVEAAWAEDGRLAAAPPPKVHVEFPVESLRSGNALQDREMWKMIDAKRFPRIAADLRDAVAGSAPGQYGASGDVTFAGRSRRYSGNFTLVRDGDRVTIDGELDVDIRDFGWKPPNLLIVKVEPVVHVRLHLAADKAA